MSDFVLQLTFVGSCAAIFWAQVCKNGEKIDAARVPLMRAVLGRTFATDGQVN